MRMYKDDIIGSLFAFFLFGALAVFAAGTFYRTAEIGCWTMRVDEETSKEVRCIYPGPTPDKARVFTYDCGLGWDLLEQRGEPVIRCRKFFRTLYFYQMDMFPWNQQ